MHTKDTVSMDGDGSHMTPEQHKWVLSTAGEAFEAKHVQPRMAACEAALESDFGSSVLARLGLNLFGMKQHVHPIYGTLSLPTKEFENGEWVPKVATWVRYDTVAQCFADRMQTLLRLCHVYPEYQAALTATDPITYVTQVSRRWSTDPGRAAKVIAIFGEVFPPPVLHPDLSTQV